MKPKIILLLILSISTLPPLFAQETEEPVVSASFAGAYGYLSTVFPTTEGSRSEAAVVALISSFLDERSIPFTISDFSGLTTGHSYSVTIESYIPGSTTDEIIVVAPLNSHLDSVQGPEGALNIALALCLAERYSLQDHAVGLRLLFPGAEFGESSSYPLGSRSFLTKYFPDGNSAVLYLDFTFPPERILLRTGDRGYASPYWIVEQILSGFDSEDLEFEVNGNETQFFRLGVAENPAPILAYLEGGYPALSLHSSKGGLAESSTDTWVESFLSSIDALMQLPEISTEWDRHYLSFQVGTLSFIIREKSYLIILLSLIGLLVAYPVVLSTRFRSYAVSIARNFWALPMLLILVFFLLLLGTLLIEGLSRLKDYPDYWTTSPALFFLLKLMTAVFFFTLISRYVKRITFPRRGRFYSAAAILILASDIVLLGVTDLSLAYYVLWACIWAFLFSLAPNRTLKALCLLLSPVWLINAVYDIFTIPATEIARELVLARTSGNLLIAFMLFPFLLMLIRLDFMFRHPKKKTKRRLLTVTYVLLGIGCGGLSVYLALGQPFDEANRQPVTISEVQSIATGNSYIDIESTAALGNLTLHTEDDVVLVESKSRKFTVGVPLRSDLISLKVDVSRFLGRATYSTVITSEGLPTTLRVRLRSEDEIILYDSSLPYAFLDSETVEVFVGKNPPNPLRIDLTVPGTLDGTLEIAAGYRDPPVIYDVTGVHLDVMQRLTVVAHATFGPDPSTD